MRLIGTPALSWRRALVLVGQFVTDPRKALWRETAGDAADWRLPEVLMSRVVNAVEYSNFLAYQMNKSTSAADWPVPEAVYPPWVQKPAPTNGADRKFGNASMSIEEMNKRLGW